MVCPKRVNVADTGGKDTKRRKTEPKPSLRDSILNRNIEEYPNITQNTPHRHPFSVLLIDATAGDYMFRNEVLRLGESGADIVVRELRTKMQEFVTARRLPGQALVDIVIRVYTSLKSLYATSSEVLKEKGASCVQSFARGAAKRPDVFHILGDDFDMVEAKDAIGGMYALIALGQQWSYYWDIFAASIRDWITHPSCDHVVLGVCSESSYAQLLEKVERSSDCGDQVTLLMSAAVERRLDRLMFQITDAFDGVFVGDGFCI